VLVDPGGTDCLVWRHGLRATQVVVRYASNFWRHHG
jgi:hypothetical protein